MSEDHNMKCRPDKVARKNAKRDSFNAADEANEIRRLIKLRRKRRFQYGKLMPFHGELASLRREGLSYRALSLWLLNTHKLKVDHSWIKRFLDQANTRDRNVG